MEKFYISTSIIYTNAPPHIGFVFETIQADVIARYQRIQGKDVFFLTGTDEHGAKVVKAAKKANKSPKEFVDEISAKVKKLTKILNLSNDDFIRTTDRKRHWPAVKKIWLKLKKNNDIYQKQYQGFYCIGCEAFITKKDLKNGKCIIHQKKPEVVKEKNYFFRLSKYSKKIEKIIKENKIKIIPQTRKNEILNFIKQGLEDISFSRPRKDLKWAIPVPDDSTASIYVWADALSNYISALGYAENSKNFKQFWPADVHCIGKDILKFHGALWLGMLLSLKLCLPKTIFVHGFISVGDQKISKSLGNIIDPFKLVEKYGTDAVRYFLLRDIHPTEDSNFTYEKFEERYNSDLVNGLGNLVARILGMTEKYCYNIVPKISKNPSAHFLRTNKTIHNSEKTWKEINKYLTNFQFNQALFSIWKFIREIDKYIEKNKPWDLAKKGKIKELNWVLYGLLDALSQIAWQIYIFMPTTSLEIAKSLQIKNLLEKKPNYKSQTYINSGIKIKKIKPLFLRIK